MDGELIRSAIDAGGLIVAVVILYSMLNRVMGSYEKLVDRTTGVIEKNAEATAQSAASTNKLSDTLDRQNGTLDRLCSSMENHRRFTEQRAPGASPSKD